MRRWLKNHAMAEISGKQARPVSAGVTDTLQKKIRYEQVRLLYQGFLSSSFSSLLVAAILVFALWGSVPHNTILLWAGALVMVAIGRLWLTMMYKKQPEASINSQDWLVWFVVGAVLNGLVWGAAGIWLMIPGSIGYQMLVVFILGGIMAGATQSLSIIMMAYNLFCIPVVLPIATWLFLQHTPIANAMGLLITLFAVSLFFIARNLHHTMSESFRLRFENIDLIADMKKEVITRKVAEERISGRSAILGMLATGCSLTEVLNAINLHIEQDAPLAKSSILLLDETGKHLLSASAPSLPEEYNAAINGGAIGPAAGSCGTAAYKNETVIVEDISSDPLWADYKGLALAHGLHACWSVPVHNTAGEVLGTFALYYAASRKPEKTEIELIQSAAQLAGIAIERCAMVEKMEQMAHYDLLTQLPNRALFIDRLKQTLALARRKKHPFALLFIDLDKFKAINDTLGHDAGDKTLQEVAGRLQACVREVDTVARLGGDEFTIILAEIHSSKDAALVAKKVLATLCREIELEGRSMSIGGSIGISLFPDDGEDVDTLIAKSDTAMYQAKQAGGDSCLFYSEIKQQAI